jgi:hypothetical protein
LIRWSVRIASSGQASAAKHHALGVRDAQHDRHFDRELQLDGVGLRTRPSYPVAFIERVPFSRCDAFLCAPGTVQRLSGAPPDQIGLPLVAARQSR